MIQFLLHLAGAVALLLWSVRMIRTGVERGFMRQLRTGLRHAAETPVRAAFGGVLTAIALQSATAVAMLATAFVASGSLASPAGLAIMLGADIGSAIVAQILFFPADAVIPILILAGVLVFFRGRDRSTKQAGRILIGLALVFISLSMIRAATAPLQDSPAIELIASYLASDLVSAFIIGGLLAFAMHSSVAAVLTFVAFCAEGLLPTPAAAAMILGANLGGAAIPVMLTLSAPAAARQLAVGNLLVRGGGAGATLLWLALTAPSLALLGDEGWRQVLNLHLAFNIAIALLALPLVRLLHRAVAIMLPAREEVVATARKTALDDGVLSDPDRALTCAQRELLRMGECVHGMLIPATAVLHKWEPDLAMEIANGERDVDKMHFDIKIYVARLQQGTLTEGQRRRALNIATAANNLEDAGDCISTTMIDMARRMKSDGISFSKDGWADLTDFHDRVTANAQLALNVLISGNPETARQVVEEKDQVRQAEQEYQERHLARLRTGNTISIESSNMHQELLRALKQINTAFSSVAYPVAEQAGELLPSRLVAAPMGKG